MPSPTRRYYSSTAVASALALPLTNSATSMAVTTVTGWPTSFPFTAIIGEDTNKEEIVTVTAASGTNPITIIRGVGGTSAQAHDAGETIRHGVYAQDFEDASAHLAATTGVHGITGTIADTSSAQTLTNKTISGSSNTLSSIPQSAITGLTGDIVGTTAVQTLTNKTVTGGTVNPTTLQQGTVQAVTVSDAQTLTNKTISGSSNTLSAIPQNAIVGVSGTLVDTASTQTLTNKTLTSPTIANLTNATHTHGSSNGGGILTQANTHQSPDTDTATTAIHHTIGTGANQAAAGNHTHDNTTYYSGATDHVMQKKTVGVSAVYDSTPNGAAKQGMAFTTGASGRVLVILTAAIYAGEATTAYSVRIGTGSTIDGGTEIVAEGASNKTLQLNGTSAGQGGYIRASVIFYLDLTANTSYNACKYFYNSDESYTQAINDATVTVVNLP